MELWRVGMGVIDDRSTASRTQDGNDNSRIMIHSDRRVHDQPSKKLTLLVAVASPRPPPPDLRGIQQRKNDRAVPLRVVGPYGHARTGNRRGALQQ